MLNAKHEALGRLVNVGKIQTEALPTAPGARAAPGRRENYFLRTLDGKWGLLPPVYVEAYD